METYKSRAIKWLSVFRQKPVDEFIVDFYCKKVQLVLEIDGVTHDGKQRYDIQRENRIKELGLNVLRLDGHYVINNITETLELIISKINEIEGNTSP